MQAPLRRLQDLHWRSFKERIKRIWPGSPQDLLTRYKITHNARTSDRISVRSSHSHKNLYKTSVKVLTDYGPLRLHHETLATVVTGGPSREFRRSTARAIRHAQSAETVARRYQKSHRTTTRAIWQTQSEERVAGFSRFCIEVYKVLRLPRKMKPAMHFACSVEKRRDISEEAVYARIYNKNAAPDGAPSSHPGSLAP